MEQPPLVSIIIPHYNGKAILYACLQGLEKTSYKNTEVVLVDNASSDDSLASLDRDFPLVKVLRLEGNRGYAGGCNAGLAAARGELILFLNNDTVFEGDWLDKLVEAICAEDEIAAVQPKLLALNQPEQFDYSGAAGGLIDIFGFAFARGRIFFTLEQDRQQYDNRTDIFWASGTALLVRKSALDKIGSFDEDFFAHMEEIDLNWRFHLHGYRVVAVPDAVVLHNSGSTLPPDSFKKVYLNHRNSLFMLLKNYETRNLIWIFPARVVFDVVAALHALTTLDFVRGRAVALSFLTLIFRFPRVMVKRHAVQRSRTCSDAEVFKKMFRGSIVVAYFVKRRHTIKEMQLNMG